MFVANGCEVTQGMLSNISEEISRQLRDCQPKAIVTLSAILHTVSLLLLVDSLSAAARSPLKQLTASLDQLRNRLQQTSHLPVRQNSHRNKNKADISHTTDKAVHSMLTTNATCACRAQLIHNLYTVCVFIFTIQPITAPRDPFCPPRVRRYWQHSWAVRLEKNILLLPVVEFLTSHLPIHNPDYPILAASQEE
jgi:hypothetical protein